VPGEGEKYNDRIASLARASASSNLVFTLKTYIRTFRVIVGGFERQRRSRFKIALSRLRGVLLTGSYTEILFDYRPYSERASERVSERVRFISIDRFVEKVVREVTRARARARIETLVLL